MNKLNEIILSKKLKITIIVLSILLITSLIGLIARWFYLHEVRPANGSAVVSENNIGEDPTKELSNNTSYTIPILEDNKQSKAANEGKNKVKLALYKENPEVNREFSVNNMLPGDQESQSFSLSLSHKESVAVYFSIEVKAQTKALGNVLRFKVTNSGSNKVIYDGAFNEAEDKEFSEIFKKGMSEETIADYKAEVYLPEETGNEYQNAGLVADFKWYVKDSDSLAPQTGDMSAPMWGGLGLLSILLLILLMIFCRKNKETKDERKQNSK